MFFSSSTAPTCNDSAPTMASVSRKLLTGSANDTLHELCFPYCDLSNDLGYCRSPCVSFCYAFCPFDLSPPPSSLASRNNHPSKLLIAILSVLAAALVLVTCYALYARFYLNPSRRSMLQDEGNERREEFSDEDHGPEVDHHIWYINTIGLQPSVITSITVCKYKRGEGLVEGTECSVCLTEFEEDETLRLLPKCSHAFHISCIDTWLRSHTNCPLCRAPIVASTVREGSPEGGDGGGDGREGARIDVRENGEGSGREMGGASEEFVRGRAEEKLQPLRRSVSLDSLSALKIRTDVGNTQHRMESGGHDSGSRGSSSRAGQNLRFVQLMSANSGSSSDSVIRSFSCSGKLFSGARTGTLFCLCNALSSDFRFENSQEPEI